MDASLIFVTLAAQLVREARMQILIRRLHLDCNIALAILHGSRQVLPLGDILAVQIFSGHAFIDVIALHRLITDDDKIEVGDLLLDRHRLNDILI